MGDEGRDLPAFACCSVGIGRWFWVVWESEDHARNFAPPSASGFEKSADLAEKRAAERLGSEVKRLTAKWASRYKRGGMAAKEPGATRGDKDGESRPQSRFSRPKGRPELEGAKPRLAFLYSAIARETPDALGHVAVARHRIVKQTARKIHVEGEPFDEDEWARRSARDAASPDLAPKPRTLVVDRFTLRNEGRFRTGRAHGNRTFYSSEEAGIRDVEAALTAKYAWCAVLGVRFPCSMGDISSAYRRMALISHPDRGGDPAQFRSAEQAYRAALAYFSKADDATS